MRDPILSKVIQAAGGVSALARNIGVKPQAISQWRRIPVERVSRVSEVTGVAPHEMRPDVFPQPASAA